MYDLKCEWCLNEITNRERIDNDLLCDSCHEYTIVKNTKVVKGCTNYEECKNEASKYVGDGTLCYGCSYKKTMTKAKETKVSNFTLTDREREKFIIGLRRALNVS